MVTVIKHRRRCARAAFVGCVLSVVAACSTNSGSPAAEGRAVPSPTGTTVAADPAPSTPDPATSDGDAASPSIAAPTTAPAGPDPFTPAAPLEITDTITIDGAPPGAVLNMTLPVTNSATINDVVLSWATARRSAFAGSANYVLSKPPPTLPPPAVPPAEATVPGQPAAPAPTVAPANPPPTLPPPIVPTLAVGAEAAEPDTVPQVVRLRVEEDLGDGVAVSRVAMYQMPNAQVILGDGLIEPGVRSELIDLVRGRVNAGPPDADGWAAGTWPGALFGSVLADIQLANDGSLTATVPGGLLEPPSEPAVVRLTPEEAAPFLSANARWLLGDAAPQWATAAADCAVDSCVALTYDDGPSPDTSRLLEVLDRAAIRATFFMIGLSVQKRPEIAKAVADAGHEIGNHTWSHPPLGELDLSDQQREVFATEYAISAATGATATMLRPPNGAYDEGTRELGFGIALWSVDTKDWDHRDPARTVERALVDTRPGSVVLMHDLHSSTVDAAALIIAGLRSDGYRFVAMGELLGTPVPGTLYFERGRTEPFTPGGAASSVPSSSGPASSVVPQASSAASQPSTAPSSTSQSSE